MIAVGITTPITDNHGRQRDLIDRCACFCVVERICVFSLAHVKAASMTPHLCIQLGARKSRLNDSNPKTVKVNTYYIFCLRMSSNKVTR